MAKADAAVRIGANITPDHAKRLEEIEKVWRFTKTRTIEELIDIVHKQVVPKAKS
jgi:hypothetical protein